MGKGQRVGSYELGKELGSGGNGKVYEAVEVLSGSVVAIKVIQDEHARSGRIE